MKKKVIGILVDALLIGMIFSITDIVALQVFHSKSIWLELGLYIVFYAIVFGSKKGIMLLLTRLVSKQKESNETSSHSDGGQLL